MRLPNGFGSVSKISGRRRNPWRVRVTARWVLNETEQTVKQTYIELGCYEKRTYGLQALTAYGSNPDIFVKLLKLYKGRHITLDELLALRLPKTMTGKVAYGASEIGTTFDQVYILWRADGGKYGGGYKTEERLYDYDHAYKLCEDIKQMPIQNVTLMVMQSLIDNLDININRASMLKQLLKAVFNYAVIHNIITTEMNRVEYLDLTKTKESEKNPSKRFSSVEIEKIWKVTKLDNADEFLGVILILIYTGLRVSELINLKKTDVLIDERYLKIIDAKTPSGVRNVPIAEKVVLFFEFWLKRGGGDNLITGRRGNNIGHAGFRTRHWHRLMNELSFKHKIHDTRHTFVSLLKTANVNDVWIKQIVGHKSQDLTDNTYTDIEIAPLIEAVNLI